jgi:hypothetical protein
MLAECSWNSDIVLLLSLLQAIRSDARCGLDGLISSCATLKDLVELIDAEHLHSEVTPNGETCQPEPDRHGAHASFTAGHNPHKGAATSHGGGYSTADASKHDTLHRVQCTGASAACPNTRREDGGAPGVGGTSCRGDRAKPNHATASSRGHFRESIYKGVESYMSGANAFVWKVALPAAQGGTRFFESGTFLLRMWKMTMHGEYDSWAGDPPALDSPSNDCRGPVVYLSNTPEQQPYHVGDWAQESWWEVGM